LIEPLIQESILEKGAEVIRKLLVVFAACVAALGFAGSALADWGYDAVAAGQGVYDRTAGTPYTTGFNWTRYTGGPKYSWYIFTSGGTLQASGIGVTYAHAEWYAGWNYRFWKFYNPSAGVQGFSVFWPKP
jgi:hypothetical protein